LSTGTRIGSVDYLVSGVGVLDKAMFVLNLVEYHQPIGFQALTGPSVIRGRPPIGWCWLWRRTAS
jgi:hypothetical protein